MRKPAALVSVVLLIASIGSSVALARDSARPAQVVPEVFTIEEFGPAASNEVGAQLLDQLEAKWGNVMRNVMGWSDASFVQFREGYRAYPAAVLEEALTARTFESMQTTLNSFATLKARSEMAKAFPARRGYAMDATTPEDASNAQLVEAKRLVAKSLGEDGRDLVFIPITPCTVWDTRFATDPPAAGIITNAVTKKFYSHFNGAGGSFAPWGGNPSCPETSQNSIGGRPYAVMLTAYINDATANGWVTFYREGDADPSQATISVYYSPGPTRTQTVITKSNRGYGVGAVYDIAVTSRFASANVAASVTGYFIKPQATALNNSNQTNTTVIANAANGDSCTAACTTGFTLTGGGCDWGSGILGIGKAITRSGPAGSGGWCCSGLNNAGGNRNLVATAYCSQVPGR